MINRIITKQQKLISGDKILLVRNEDYGVYHLARNQYPDSGVKYKKFISFNIGECEVIGSWNIKEIR